MSLQLQSRVTHVPKGPQTSDYSFNQHSLAPGPPIPANLSVAILVEGGGQLEGLCSAGCPPQPSPSSSTSSGTDFLPRS